MKYFAFKWVYEDRSIRLFLFKVLVFGLSSAPYIFTKVMKQVVKFWREHTVKVVIYLDDGMGEQKLVLWPLNRANLL